MHLKVRVYAKSSKEEVIKAGANRLTIWVKEPTERNRANKRIRALIQEMYPDHRVTIIIGHHSPSKIISIEKGM